MDGDLQAQLETMTEALEENTQALQAFREEMHGLRKELLPVVESIHAAGGVAGLVAKVKEYAPLIKKLSGFFSK